MVFVAPASLKLPGLLHAILIQKDTGVFDILYPEYRNNGIIKYIVRYFHIYEFNWYKGTVTKVATYDIESITGFTNPIVSATPVGYDLDKDAALLAVGEWDGQSPYPYSAKWKVIRLYRDGSKYEVVIDDVLQLIKTAISDVDIIKGVLHCFIYKSVGVCAVKPEAAGQSKAVLLISTDGGNTWTVERTNKKGEYPQNSVEPLWDNGIFKGFITGAESGNVYCVNLDGVPYFCGPEGDYNTLSPVYDMIKNRILYLEYGATTTTTLHILEAPPDQPSNVKDVTPTGKIYDQEGNSIDLSGVQKYGGFIARLYLKEGIYDTLVFEGYGDGVPAGEVRMIMGSLDMQNFEVVATPDGNDAFTFEGTYVRAFNIKTKLPLPSPIIPCPEKVSGSSASK